MPDFPVGIDNVVYLDGKPPQDVLKGTADSYISVEALDAVTAKFNAMLARHGRPHGSRHITTSFGANLVDLVAGGGGVLRRAQWFDNKGEYVIVEAHGNEIDGWWMQAAEGVLLHVPFGSGLTVEETARALAESSEPAPALVDYLRNHINDERLCSNRSILPLLPDDLCLHLGVSFRCSHRIARLREWWDTKEERVFGLYEAYTWKDCREIEPE